MNEDTLELYTFYDIDKDVALESAMDTIREKIQNFLNKIKEFIQIIITWIKNVFKKKINEMENNITEKKKQPMINKKLLDAYSDYFDLTSIKYRKCTDFGFKLINIGNFSQYSEILEEDKLKLSNITQEIDEFLEISNKNIDDELSKLKSIPTDKDLSPFQFKNLYKRNLDEYEKEIQELEKEIQELEKNKSKDLPEIKIKVINLEIKLYTIQTQLISKKKQVLEYIFSQIKYK